MNRLIPRIGAAMVAVTVFLFAVCMIVGYLFGSYLVCMFLPIGYILMAAGFYHESREDRRVAAGAGMVIRIAVVAVGAAGAVDDQRALALNGQSMAVANDAAVDSHCYTLGDSHSDVSSEFNTAAKQSVTNKLNIIVQSIGFSTCIDSRVEELSDRLCRHSSANHKDSADTCCYLLDIV